MGFKDCSTELNPQGDNRRAGWSVWGQWVVQYPQMGGGRVREGRDRYKSHCLLLFGLERQNKWPD